MLKKIKTIILFLMLLFLTILYFQNKSYFTTETTLTLDLFFKTYTTPSLSNYLFFLAAMFLGFLFALIPFLALKLKEREYVKALDALSYANEKFQEKLNNLKAEISVNKEEEEKKEYFNSLKEKKETNQEAEDTIEQ